MNIEDQIRLNAESVVHQFGWQLDRESVIKLDQHIEEIRAGIEENKILDIVNELGSFLGECLRENFGGIWVRQNDNIVLKFDNGSTANPFGKVNKQLQYGITGGESVRAFYDSAAQILKIEPKG